MAEPFSNDPIVVEQLPQLHGDAFVPVDPRYIWGALVWLMVTAIAVVAVGAVVAVRSENTVVPAVVAGGIVVLLAVASVVQVLESRRLAYQLREHDVSLRSGVFRHRVETIPFSRVQHVSVGRGLIERWLGLATLEVSSAGPDISVPGLSVPDADRVKQVVAERAGVDDDQQDVSTGSETGHLAHEPPVSGTSSASPLPPPPWPTP